jgi:hypothetical protein
VADIVVTVLAFALFRRSAWLSFAIETFAFRANGSSGSPHNSRATNAISR